MKGITKRIISTLAICGALVLEAGVVAFGSLGKNSVSRVDATTITDQIANWNTLFGTSYSGSISGVKANQLTLSGNTTNGISLVAKNGSSTNGYVNNTDFRMYNGYTLTVTAPTNYNITSLSASKSGKTINSIAADVGTLSIATDAASMSWTGSNNKIIFSISGTMGFSSMSITISNGSEPTTYSVTYDGNGNTGGSVPTDGTSYSSGASVTVKGNTGSLVKTDYTFAGWNTQSDGNGTDYAASGSATFNITANTTLYAKWTQDSPTPVGDADIINFDLTKDNLNGTATSDWVTFSKTLSSGASVTIRSMGTKGTNNALQWNKNAYLYMTTSGGTLKSVTVKGASKKINIFGSTSAFSGEPTGTATGSVTGSSSGATYTFAESSEFTYLAMHGTDSSTTISEITINYRVAKTLESIEVKTVPLKVDYTAGENFDPTGLKITATYDSGDPEDIAYAGNESKFTFNPSTNLTQGTTSVQITYGGKSCNQAITVGAAVTLTSIQSITGSLTAIVGGSWNTSSIVVNGLMSDGSTKVITSDCNITVNTAVPSSAGTGNASVTATYKTDGSKTKTVTNIPYTVSVEHGTTPEDPFTIDEAKAIIDGSESVTASKTYYIKGYFQSVAYAWTDANKNMSVWVSATSSGSGKDFEFYKMSIDFDPNFSSGDEIIVSALGEDFTKYGTTYEVNPCAFYNKPYDVTFDGNGAEEGWENPSISQTWNSNYDLPATNPTKTGYNFAGWFTSPTDGTEITTESIAPKTSVGTLYAHWSIQTFTVYYDKGQYGVGDNQTDTKIYDVDLNIKAGIFTRTGYAQAGWATEDGGARVYDFGAKYTENKSITLYPVWMVQRFTVMYKPGEGVTGEEYIASKQYGVPLTLRGETYYKEGHTQTGWATEDGGEKVYDLEGSYTNNTASFFFPFWTADTYTVTYNPGEDGTGEQSTATKTYGVDLTLPGAIFTRSGYKQTGWALTDGGEKVYDLEGTYSNNAGTTLYPVWSEIPKHSVTYLANGATGDVPTQENVAEGSTFTIADATSLTKQNYHFIGWNDGTSTYQPEETYTMGTSNVTLTAQWELDTVKYSVGYSLTGVTVPVDAPTEVEEGDDLVVAVTPNQHYKIETMGVTMGGETAEYTYENGVLTVEDVTGNIVVTVSAAEKWYGATTSSSQNVTFGSIDAHLYHNEPFDVDVTANTGCHIVDEYSSVSMWKEGGGFEDIPDAYSNGHIHVDHVTGNLVLQIIAVKDTFSVTSTLNDSKVAEGSELPDTVEYGDDLNVTFEPLTGYQINSITYKVGEAAEQTVTGSTLSIENITANVLLTVNTSKIVYSVTATYGDSTNSNTSTSIEYGDSYSGKITPNDGKKFTSISMTMGGNPVTVAEDGTYNIASVTGNIVINVVTTDITYAVSETGSNYTNSNTATSVLWHGAYEATITPDDGYFIEDLDVTMGGEPVTVSIADHGTSATISIASVTGDIDIDVTSTEIEMTGIVSAATKEADYEFGYDFDESDVAVVASFNDGITGSVDATSVEGYDITKSGSQTVTVKVGEFEKEITVVIRQSTVIDSIEASTEKTEVEYGGTFTEDDVSVTYIYTDGHTLPNQAADSITGFDPNEVGTQTVTVTAAGKTDTITVTVLPSTVVQSIEASTEKTEIEYGGTLTPEDITVIATYTDGHTGEIDCESISGFSGTIVGQQNVTVNAGGKQDVIQVTVKPSEVIDHIEASTEKSVVDYGGTFTKEDVSVTYVYTDGHTVEGQPAESISEFNPTQIGEQEITVTAAGKTTTITVTVNGHVVLSLDVTGYDEYVDQGKEYAFNGTVTAHYADGTTEDVTANAVVSKVDTSGHGPAKATVSFGGVSTEITINVIQTKTPVEAYQAVAIAGGAVIAVSAIAVGIFFFLKKFKI